MSKNQDYVFVLWDDQFEEMAAVIFVTELRAAGLRANIVGLTARQARGRYGLVLIPDLTLGQALALTDRAGYVVIPCTPAGLKRLKNDPRVHQLFQQAHANGARFVIEQTVYRDGIDLELFPPEAEIIVYPEREALVQFIRTSLSPYF